jgi:hypothetical protein
MATRTAIKLLEWYTVDSSLNLLPMGHRHGAYVLPQGLFVCWREITDILTLQVAFWAGFKRDRETTSTLSAAALVTVGAGAGK